MSTSPVKKKGSGIAFVLPPPRSADVASPPAPAAAAATPAPAPVSAEAATAFSAPSPALPPVRAMPRTGVGLLATTVFETAKLEERVGSLQAEVQRLEAERGGQLLDARVIVPSRWANRHPDAFDGPAFEELKRDIQDAGGNVQPIKVRPLSTVATASSGGEGGNAARYEIVFGHRRHCACLELGLPVLAVVQDLADRDLFVHMERENRARQNLSAWEQGRMYLRALNEGLFPSNRQLAAAIGRGVSDVGKALRIAQLPEEVIGAFPSPNAIQFRWATDLLRALEKDVESVLDVAGRLADADPRPGAAEVFTALTAVLRETGGVRRSHAPVRQLDLGEGREATVRADSKGRTFIELGRDLLPPARWGELERLLRKLVD